VHASQQVSPLYALRVPVKRARMSDAENVERTHRKLLKQAETLTSTTFCGLAVANRQWQRSGDGDSSVSERSDKTSPHVKSYACFMQKTTRLALKSHGGIA